MKGSSFWNRNEPHVNNEGKKIEEEPKNFQWSGQDLLIKNVVYKV